MKKGYVILEIGWEYNDETYHTSNYGTTYEAPTTVYTDLEKAKEKAKELEYKSFRGEMIFIYGYEIEDILTVDTATFVKEWNEMFNKELDLEDYWNDEVPRDATDEQIEKLMEMVNVRFYEVKEIEIHE